MYRRAQKFLSNLLVSDGKESTRSMASNGQEEASRPATHPDTAPPCPSTSDDDPPSNTSEHESTDIFSAASDKKPAPTLKPTEQSPAAADDSAVPKPAPPDVLGETPKLPDDSRTEKANMPPKTAPSTNPAAASSPSIPNDEPSTAQQPLEKNNKNRPQQPRNGDKKETDNESSLSSDGAQEVSRRPETTVYTTALCSSLIANRSLQNDPNNKSAKEPSSDQRKTVSSTRPQELPPRDSVNTTTTTATSSASFRDSDEQWNAMLLKLTKFKDANGHCNVPSRYGDDASLAYWVQLQRTKFFNNSLSDERVAVLNGIRFHWDPSGVRRKYRDQERSNKAAALNRSYNPVEFDAWWNTMFTRLKAYHKQHGNCFVPDKYEADQSLAYWVQCQRTSLFLRKLSNKHKESLDQLGFHWNGSRHLTDHHHQWFCLYERLCAYKHANGDCRVPARYSQDPSLGFWTQRQRNAYQYNRMGDERKEAFDTLGTDWHVNVEQNGRPMLTSEVEENWFDMLQRLKDYKAEHGDYNVPYTFEPDRPLGAWVKRQRYQNSKGRLSEKRKLELDLLEFPWKVYKKQKTSHDKKEFHRGSDTNWFSVFHRLRAYKQANGDCRVPTRYLPDQSLGSWVQYQRSVYHSGKLTAERKAALDIIGFEYGVKMPKKTVSKYGGSTTKSEPGDNNDWFAMFHRLRHFKKAL